MQVTERAEKMPFLSLVTLTFKHVRARDQTRFPCEYGAKPFSRSPDISYTNKKPQTDGAKNRTFRSSPRAVKITSLWSTMHGNFGEV